MKKEYRCLIGNDAWDPIPLAKVRNMSSVNGCIALSLYQMEVLRDIKPI